MEEWLTDSQPDVDSLYRTNEAIMREVTNPFMKKQNQPNAVEAYYTAERDKVIALISSHCQTDEQKATMCALALTRLNTEFESLKNYFQNSNLPAGYQAILNDMENLVCSGTPITVQMGQSYVDWCLSITRVIEKMYIGYQSFWLLQILPDLIEDIGQVLSDWVDTKGAFSWDAETLAMVGTRALCYYECFLKNPNPKNYTNYEFIRLRHPEIDLIAQQRDAFVDKAEYDEDAYNKYRELADLFHAESEKYWAEAVAEKKRLIDEYKPITADDLILTMKELERVRSDVEFISDNQRSKDDIRQRLESYRTLNIAEM